MTTTRKKYTRKFKDEAVELFLATDLPITHVASNVGVKAGTLGNWIKKYREDNPEKFDTGPRKCLSFRTPLEAQHDLTTRKPEVLP